MQTNRKAMVFAVLGALWAVSAAAQDYPARQVNLVIGGAPGSGYDVIGRLVAAHLGKYIPGNPKIIVRDMPHTAIASRLSLRGLTATPYLGARLDAVI